MPPTFHAGSLLRAACEHHKARTHETFAAIAERAGVPRPSLQRAFRDPNASTEMIRKVCDALGLRVILVPVEGKP